MLLPAFLNEFNHARLKILLLAFLVAIITLFALVLQFGPIKYKAPDDTKKKIAQSLVTPTKVLASDGKQTYVSPSVFEVDAESLNDYLEQGDSLKIIQVGSQDEWETEHFKNSMFLPLSAFDHNILEHTDKVLVLVSKDGVDSIIAASKLVDTYAFTRSKVWSLKGGLNAWKKAGYSLEK